MLAGITNLLGRIAIAFLFIGAALGNLIPNWSNAIGYMEANGMPGGALAHFLLFGAVSFQLLGGVALVLGVYTRVGLLLLIVFLIPATVIFHDFWTLPPAEQQPQVIHFMKNLAVLGALLFILGSGAGPFSVDRFLKRRRARSAIADPTPPPMQPSRS